LVRVVDIVFGGVAGTGNRLLASRTRSLYRAAGTTAAIIHRRMIAGLRDICSDTTPFLIFRMKGAKALYRVFRCPLYRKRR
jgi:hypothetical protein